MNPLLAILISLTVALVSPSALADSAVTGTDSPQLQYRRAHEAIRAKDWDEARRLLLDLWARAHTYDVGSSLVYVENQAQHYAAAATYAAFAIQNAPPIEKPEEIERLRRALDELKGRVGIVAITVSRPGAEVRVDSELVGTAPLPSEVYVEAGRHAIEARVSDAPPVSTSVDALSGQTYRIDLNLPPAPAAPAATPVSPSSPRAEAPPAGDDRGARSHRRSKAPAIVAASVGGLGLVGGIVSFVVSANKRAASQDRLGRLGGQNPCGTGVDPTRAGECSNISELADGADTFRALGFVGLGTAVAGGALTFALWPRASRDTASAPASPAVSVTAGGFTAAVRGVF